MFKTKDQIEEMAKAAYPEATGGSYVEASIRAKRVNAYILGATQMQKDLLESASERFDYWWNDGKDIPEILGRASQVVLAITNMSERCSRLSEFWAKESWQAAKLSSKAQIDTLKQRELEYQSDLREKGRLINEKSNQIIEITKELQEKDERIKKLEFMIENGLGWEDMKPDGANGEGADK